MKFLILIGLLLSSVLHAQIFDISVVSYGTLADPTAQNFINTQIQNVENDVNEDLPNANPTRLMQGMANSSALATKGVGTDYASNMEVFLLGASLGAGVDQEKQDNSDSEISGAGIAPGAVIGTKLDFLGYEDWAFYFNFMNYTHTQELDKDQGDESSITASMFTIGAHFRYDMIERTGGKMLGWGGLKLHFGYDYNATRWTFKDTLSESVDETSATGERVRGTIVGNPEAKINVFTHSIPIEISTDIQLLYILNLYGGIGTDINFGQAKGEANLNADDSNLTCTGGVCTGETITVRATANIDGQSSVHPFFIRGFLGAQFNLPFFQVYGQVNKTIGNELLGVSAGARFVY